jgi:hypothetical protein
LQDGWAVWDAVEEQHKAGLLPPSFFAKDNRWLWRGKEYRELAEPLDIANWYMKNKQWEYKEKYGCVEEGYHYAQGIDTETDELTVDNDRRPSRYRLLQRMERNALGSAAPSMGLARKLAAQLGNRKWQDVVADKQVSGGLFVEGARVAMPHCHVWLQLGGVPAAACADAISMLPLGAGACSSNVHLLPGCCPLVMPQRPPGTTADPRLAPFNLPGRFTAWSPVRLHPFLPSRWVPV